MSFFTKLPFLDFTLLIGRAPRVDHELTRDIPVNPAGTGGGGVL